MLVGRESPAKFGLGFVEIRMRMILLSACLLCVVASVMAKPQQEPAAPLPGTWKVALAPDEASAKAGEKAFEETLTFKDGNFRADGFVARGFDWVKYKLEDRPEITVFIAEAKSAKGEGAAQWTGHVNGQKLIVSLMWTKADGSVARWSGEGKKIEPPGDRKGR